MSANGAPVLVHMVRPTLDGLPAYPTPAGYSLRTYRPGDEEAWVSIHVEADHWNRCAREIFEREFGLDPLPLSARQFYLCSAEQQPIGTASGWFAASPSAGPCSHYGPAWGRIHWVALLPQYQSRGLSKPLLAAACQRLRDLGHSKAYLVTSTVRIPAINLYLSFGFEPEIVTGEQEAAWSSIRDRLRGMP